MKLFGRTGGHYLFWTGLVYLVIGLTCSVYYKAIPAQYIQIVWIAVMALPFTYPPLGRYFNMTIDWDKKMFNWFNKDKTPSNVVPFPEPKDYPKMPYIESPEEKYTTYYRLGVTSDNRVNFQVGYSELTMNKTGVQNLIEQLQVFRDQLAEDADK